jgi:TonB family protein
LIHFDFEERYQDEQVVGRGLSASNIVVLSLVLHVLVILLIQVVPRMNLFLPNQEELERRRQELARQQMERERNERRFVFVAPRIDTPAPPKQDVPLSDLDRRAKAPERAAKPDNPLPFARGNTPERIDQAQAAERAKGPETETKPDNTPPQADPAEQVARALPPSDQGIRRAPETSRPAPGALGDALRNLQRYVQNETFNNPQGGANDPGTSIQFDSKGVDFGPWLRRFVAQVRRNWFVPYAAMTFHGRVVLQFNIHKNGTITDVVVASPSDIDAFTRAANNAILGSNPTEPLPTAYPDPMAFFTVTFYYNEQPPMR